MALAPVALFVYNRVDNTRQTLQALSQNTLASETEVYVFSDGGRDKSSWKAVEQVREVIRSTQMAAAFKRLILIERLENFYLEHNITEGIEQVLKDHDRIIVLDKGHIVEDGSYDELIAKNGFFAELVERQRVDI